MWMSSGPSPHAAARARPAIALLTLALVVFANRALAQDGRVVVLGFDGADARLVETWMDQGELPHLARLRAEGGYAPLRPTNPPQTPVSWSSFATGTDPGSTEIFDFIKRDPDTYRPAFTMTTDTERVFLFGSRTSLVLGAGFGAAAMLLTFAASLLVRVPWGRRLAACVGIAFLVGVPVLLVARAYLPGEVPDVVNNRRGRTLWEVASAAGKRVTVIRVPATYPAENVSPGHMLSGLGVPDIRGRVGTPIYYTSDPDFRAPEDQFNVELVRLPARRGRIQTTILGPRNLAFYDYVVARRAEEAPPGTRSAVRQETRAALDAAGVPARIDLALSIEATDTGVVLGVAGRSATLKAGEWTDWFELPFPVNPVMDRVSPWVGMTRFKLLSLEPHLQLYASPVNFHPDCHPVAFAWPPAYSEELRERFGLFKTIGWALDTWSLPSGVGGEELFLEDMRFTVDRFEKILDGLVADGEQDLFVQIFYFTDRIAHLFWRFVDPGHPLYDPAQAARYGGELLAAYQRMDAIVGRVLERVGPDDLLIVCSDHGFSSFRRGVNYNRWLVDNGFMKLKQGAVDSGPALQNVDWSGTRAYALGLGSIYINLIGRERQGTVLPGPEYQDVRSSIVQGLEQLVDPSTGEHPVSRVLTREEMYRDYDADLIPDLRASNNSNYRVSWETTLGGMGPTLLADNTNPWSGDHASNDPEQVRGVFFINRAIGAPEPRMIDIMPTVLDALDVEVPEEVQGRSLL